MKPTPTQIRDQARRYLKVVEWSDEDGCYIGSAPPLIGQCCHGDTEAAVLKQLNVIVEEWVTTLLTDGKPLPAASVGKRYSGKFLVRVPPDIHKKAVLKAQALEAYKLQYGDYPQIGRYTTATAPTAASNSNQPGLLFNALMGKLGPIHNTFNNTLGKAFVEPSKLSTINADYPAASGNTLVANAFIDPWGRAYLYSYRTSATGGGGWLKPSYYLYSVGPTNNHDAPDATGTVTYETANNADNLYAKR